MWSFCIVLLSCTSTIFIFNRVVPGFCEDCSGSGKQRKSFLLFAILLQLIILPALAAFIVVYECYLPGRLTTWHEWLQVLTDGRNYKVNPVTEVLFPQDSLALHALSGDSSNNNNNTSAGETTGIPPLREMQNVGESLSMHVYWVMLLMNMIKEFVMGYTHELSVMIVVHHVVSASTIIFYILGDQMYLSTMLATCALEMGSGALNLIDLGVIKHTRFNNNMVAFTYLLSNTVPMFLTFLLVQRGNVSPFKWSFMNFMIPAIPLILMRTYMACRMFNASVHDGVDGNNTFESAHDDNAQTCSNESAHVNGGIRKKED